MLSNFSFAWLPERNKMKQSKQLSWHRSKHSTSLQMSAELGIPKSINIQYLYYYFNIKLIQLYKKLMKLPNFGQSTQGKVTHY